MFCTPAIGVSGKEDATAAGGGGVDICARVVAALTVGGTDGFGGVNKTLLKWGIVGCSFKIFMAGAMAVTGDGIGSLFSSSVWEEKP